MLLLKTAADGVFNCLVNVTINLCIIIMLLAFRFDYVMTYNKITEILCLLFQPANVIYC